MIYNVLTNNFVQKVSQLFHYMMCKVLDIFTIKFFKQNKLLLTEDKIHLNIVDV